MSNYKSHAMAEFRAAGWIDADGKFDDEMQELMCKQILELLEVFDTHGHSGYSASYALDLFTTLANFKPIVPLTGEDWEWNDVSEYGGNDGVSIKQNNRCSTVFIQSDRFDGQAYDINGIVFYDIMKDEEGEEYKSYFTNGDSQVPVTFPYTPTTKYVERP